MTDSPAEAPAPVDVVLAGGGHAHVETLRSFGVRPFPGARLTLISKELHAPYSGMLPGMVAGRYTPEESHIDLARLARFAGARLIHGAACGVDRAARRVEIAGRPPVSYDLLSIDVGITPDLSGVAGAERHALAVKPVSEFAAKWRGLQGRLSSGERVAAVIVGGGAAGFELGMAIRSRFGDAGPVTLVAGGGLLPGFAALPRRLARRALREAGVRLIEGERVAAVSGEAATLSSGETLPCDAAIVATGARPPSWFDGLDLPRDRDGYLAVRPTLQLLDDDDVFAVGDCAAIEGCPRPKSGVYAVRQGPPLTRNLRRRLEGRPVEPFRPQSRSLYILSRGDGSAIAAYGWLALSGRWAWRWKDWIDRRFIRRFNDLPDTADARSPSRRAG